MPSYSATLSLHDGTLSVTQPHPTPEAVSDLIDSCRYAILAEDNPVTSVGITLVTDDTAPAVTPPLPDQLPNAEDTGPRSGKVSGPLPG